MFRSRDSTVYGPHAVLRFALRFFLLRYWLAKISHWQAEVRMHHSSLHLQPSTLLVVFSDATIGIFLACTIFCHCVLLVGSFEVFGSVH